MESKKIKTLPTIGHDWYEGCRGKYIIISLKHSTKDCTVYFLPGCYGYTKNLAVAGKFNISEIVKRIDYFNNGLSTMAVPLTYEAFGLLGLDKIKADLSESVRDEFITRVTNVF